MVGFRVVRSIQPLVQTAVTVATVPTGFGHYRRRVRDHR